MHAVSFPASQDLEKRDVARPPLSRRHEPPEDAHGTPRRTLALAALLLGGQAACGGMPIEAPQVGSIYDIAQLAPGWTGEIVATVEQSYAGWDVEIGDADGDGRPEILTGTAPDSWLQLHRWRDGAWQTRTLMTETAGNGAGLLLGVRVVDVERDGVPEILAGTGQDGGGTAWLHVLQTDGESITGRTSLRAPENTSSYTHGLATADLDGDGLVEVISAYCGNGEVIRYDVAPQLASIASRKVLQLSGSGEDAWLSDVDGDGAVELVLSNGFRAGKARVQIHDLDPTTGDPQPKPRVVIDGFDGERAFYASLAVGDMDDDGRPELVVGWKAVQTVNEASLVAYHIEGQSAKLAYVLTRKDPELDLGYFEKMIAFADVDDDGRTEVLVSTRGDGLSESIPSLGLGHVLAFRVERDGHVSRQQVVAFNRDLVGSSWLAVGDADGDGRTEVVLATGSGERTRRGTSWVVALRHD